MVIDFGLAQVNGDNDQDYCQVWMSRSCSSFFLPTPIILSLGYTTAADLVPSLLPLPKQSFSLN